MLAGTHGIAIHDHCARAALSEAASESRAMQFQVVAQDVQKRRGRVNLNDSRLAIHFQRDSRHGEIPFSTGRSKSTWPTLAICSTFTMLICPPIYTHSHWDGNTLKLLRNDSN